MQVSAGIMKITLIEAKLTRDTEFFGKMSPYCTMVFRNKKFKTKVLDYAGKTPKWNETFTIEI